MKLLWSTSFRSFGKSSNNDHIQNLFLSSLVSAKFDLTVFATQFGEHFVEDAIKQKQLKYIYKLSSGKGTPWCCSCFANAIGSCKLRLVYTIKFIFAQKKT